MKQGGFIWMIVGILFITSSVKGSDTIWFLEGEKLQIRMDKKAIISIGAQSAFGIQSYHSWSEFWGGGYWIYRTSDSAQFCFDPYWTGDYPKPYDVGTLIVYTSYYGRADTLEITMVPGYKPYHDGSQCEVEADPIVPLIGNYLSSQFGETDITLASRGFNIEFKRIYASQEKENADTIGNFSWMKPFGSGQTHSYNVFLKVVGDYYNTPYDWSVLLCDYDGNGKLFSWTGSVYTSEKGEHLLLEKTGTSPNFQWTLNRPDGTKWYFKQRSVLIGKLDSIIDANDNKITLTYTGDNLTKITDPMGKEINIIYNNGLIQKVYEPPNTTNGIYCEYVYELNGATYDLIKILKIDPLLHDSTTLDRYYYNSDHSIYTYVFPTGQYNENNDTTWNYKKGDRVNCWYDSLGRCIYQEVVNGDGDTLLTNDRVVFRARLKYFINSSSGYTDSTRIYYYEDTTYIGALNPKTDTAPAPPTTNHIRKTIRFHQNGNMQWEKIYHHPSALSITTTYGSYDADYNPASITDPDNKTTNFTYHSYSDANGSTRYLNRAKKVKYATDDSVLTYYSTYASNSRFFLPDSTRDELNRKINYMYDNNGNLDTLQYYQRNLVGQGSAQNVNNDFDHNAKGNLTQTIDAESNRNYFHYAPNDTGSYLTESRVDIGNNGEDNQDLVVRYRYNANRGTLDTVVYYHDFPSDSIKVYYFYDLFKRLEKITYPDNTYEKYTYDKRGNLLEKKISTTEVDLVYKIQYEYDTRNRMTMVKEYPDLGVLPPPCDTTRYVYNLHDALTEFSNANDFVLLNTTIEYDYVADRLYRTRYADNNKDSLGYFSSGYLQFKKDRRGKVIDYSYDNQWRLLKKRFYNSWNDYTSNNPSDSVVSWLNKVGNTDSLLDSNGKIKYTYDGLDRMYELNAYGSNMVKYVYDKMSNKTRLKVCKTSDTTVVYLEQTYPSYDEGNRLLKTIVYPDTFEFTYWDTGPIKQISYTNDVKEQYWLTDRNFIDSMRVYYSEMQVPWFESKYTYNELGDLDSLWLRLSRPSLSSLSGYFKYTYDGVKRLTNSTTNIREANGIKYIYDAVGNRMKKIVSVDTTEYTYNKQNNHMTYAGEIQYVCDNNGNVTGVHPVEEIDYYYTWDYKNRLTKVKKAGSGINDSLRFTYCALGKRIQKLQGTSDTTRYAYDGMYVVCKYGNNDSLLSKYVYANRMLLARIDSSGDRYYYHHDGLGSVVGITDTLRNIVQSYLYDDFGDLWNSWGNLSNKYMYTGQEYDDEISGAELYNLRARYYDPDIGRFMSEDLIWGIMGLPQSLNLYVYVNNSPLNHIDPTGLYRGCRLLTSYPVNTWSEKVGETVSDPEWTFQRAIAWGDVVYQILCMWDYIINITENWRDVIQSAYVVKCYEECQPPVIRSYDVLEYGPLYHIPKSKKGTERKWLPETHSILETWHPAYLEDWCRKAGPPSL